MIQTSPKILVVIDMIGITPWVPGEPRRGIEWLRKSNVLKKVCAHTGKMPAQPKTLPSRKKNDFLRKSMQIKEIWG
jgi:hypothetical protein